MNPPALKQLARRLREEARVRDEIRFYPRGDGYVITPTLAFRERDFYITLPPTDGGTWFEKELRA